VEAPAARGPPGKVARHGRKSKAGVNGEEQQPAERFGILVVPAVRAPAEESDDAISDVLIERTPERRLACELEGPGHNYTPNTGDRSRNIAEMCFQL